MVSERTRVSASNISKWRHRGFIACIRGIGDDRLFAVTWLKARGQYHLCPMLAGQAKSNQMRKVLEYSHWLRK